ncbi:hypothetical protein PVL29_025451 [Vitis rotundifolia]|uniref:Uncharacterized protein n=1 Tax=Vitis rotundifolia TaxID=103349 RepID=A0AA38YJS1_VITRO|nr:hypothetical protein PVL29_025451 [Vitis rotundifolia]
MAKNRNKKKRSVVAPMDTAEPTLTDIPQAMDTSDSVATTATHFPASGAPIKRKKGVTMKRSKNVRKMKAIAKAVSQNEKSMEKISKNESKTMRSQSAKMLYD